MERSEGIKMKILKRFLKIGGVLLGVFVLAHAALYVYCLITPKMDINKSQSYYLYDNESKLVFDDGDEWVSLDNISPYLIEATINTEDQYFYYHVGFDYFRIAKAMVNNIISGSMSEGASTITQQYARNLFLNFDKNWSRKIDEAVLAFELETHYTKDEILEGYLNTINYGGVMGIQNASKYYFNKEASDLTLAESAMLAGIPQSPANNSPLTNPEKAKSRQELILTMMMENGIITEEEMNDAIKTKLTYATTVDNNELTAVAYFRDAVIEELNSIETIPKSLIETGGLYIYTTLDVDAQKALEDAVNNNMDSSKELQVAGMMMDPNNGGVMALIGGVNYSASQFNRATNAKRQVGSTMKPFLYYAALESGFTASSAFTSEKTTFSFSNNKTYTPNNYNDTYANMPISMGAAVSYSYNIYAVKTHLFLGENMLVDMAKKVGITSELEPIPSLALGSEEISMIDMVTGYSAFANLGSRVTPHFIEKVLDSKGNVLYEFKDTKEQVLNSSNVFILNDMLTYTYDTSFVDYNTPTVLSLLPKMTHKYGIKTGTTDTDYWIMGFNQDAVLGIWNGYDDNRKVSSEDNGYHKNIWVETMETYFKDKDPGWYDIPDNVVGVLVNPITGQLAEEGESNKSKIFYFIKGTEPNVSYVSNDLDEAFKEENHVVSEEEESE